MIDALCFNPFLGQTVLMTEPPNFPNFLLPQFGFDTGGKPVSGGYYNLVSQAAATYGFKLVINFNVIGGDYLMDNNTFTPGKYYSVSN